MTDHKDLIARLDGAYLNYEMPKQLAELQDEAQRAIAALVAERDAAVADVGAWAAEPELPQPQLLVEAAQGFVEGWTRSQVRSAINLALLTQRYTTPPAPLTLSDEQITAIYCQVADGKEWAIGGLGDAIPFARAVLAAAQEKS